MQFDINDAIPGESKCVFFKLILNTNKIMAEGKIISGKKNLHFGLFLTQSFSLCFTEK